MSVTLQATGGPGAGTKIVVARGQVVHVGRTNWADRSIPGDTALAEVHFAIDFKLQPCRIQDLSGGRGTLLNGEKIAEAAIHTGDVVQAGQTKFSVLVQGEPAAAAEAAADVAAGIAAHVEPAAVAGPESTEKMARDYAAPLKLGADAMALLEDRQPPEEYLDLLVAHDLLPDALRFVAFWLPKPAAVAWGCDCLDSVAGDRLTPEQQQALGRARQWSAEPCEKNRRRAEAAAESANYEGPASFLAAAAFWSGGSLAPAGLAEVPPVETLTAQGVSGALLVAGTWGDPTQSAVRYRGFLQEGKKLAASQPKS